MVLLTAALEVERQDIAEKEEDPIPCQNLSTNRPFTRPTDSVEELNKTIKQWRSGTFGRPGRWSNLPPFRLRFLKLESLFKA